jgi:hypothetical protein
MADHHATLGWWRQLKSPVEFSQTSANNMSLTVAQREPNCATFCRFSKSSPLFWCLQDQRRHGLGEPGVLIDGHKSYIRGRRMLPLLCHRVFGIHLDADFHRGAEDTINLRFQVDELTQIYRVAKIDVVHGRRHHITIGMSVRRHRRHHIDQMHHLPAKQFPQRVRLRRQHNLRHLRSRRIDGLALQRQFPAHLTLHQLLALHSLPVPRLLSDAVSFPV